MTKAGPLTVFERSSDGGHIATGAMEEQKFSLPKTVVCVRVFSCFQIGSDSAAESRLDQLHTPHSLAWLK
jgi:hypothetical protein